MGIFNFLKDIFKEKEQEEEKKEKINLSKLDSFIEKKETEIKNEEKERIKEIERKIGEFSEEVNEKIKILNKVDIDSKEKNEKIKSAVNDGRKRYIDSLEKFLNHLEESIHHENQEKISLEKVIADINRAFIRLNENSSKSYEKATILIGKEMGEIRESLKRFSNELISIFEPGRELILNSKKVNYIRSMLLAIRRYEEEARGISRNLEDINLQIKNQKEDETKINDSIDEIKNSKEYSDNEERKKNVQLQEKEIEKTISELRGMIDFKSLSNFFHIFEDKMEIVKLYRDNFPEEFNKDYGERILNLLDESKLNSKDKEDKVVQIKILKEKIKEEKSKIKSNMALELYSELEKKKDAIKELEKEKEWKEKNIEDTNKKIKENLKSIQGKMGEMGIEFEY